MGKFYISSRFYILKKRVNNCLIEIFVIELLQAIDLKTKSIPKY